VTAIKSNENSTKERKKQMWVSREGRTPTQTGDVSLSFIGYCQYEGLSVRDRSGVVRMTRGKQKWVGPTGSRLECVQFSAGLAPMVEVRACVY